jgi:hypothetical protein
MKIAFCFLIYKEIDCEELWNSFFKGVDKSKYNIYIHYKENTQLKFLENYKLSDCINTTYGDISIIKAFNFIFKHALNDNNDMFLLLSGECIPLKPFDFIYNELMKNREYSYFNICPQTQCFPRCNPTLSFIPREYIQKASQWCILNKKHIELILSDTNYLKWFDYEGTIPDEHCYITCLFYNKLQDELILTPNETFSTTFVNWKDSGYKYSFGYENSKFGNKNYSNISKEEIDYILQSPSFFGRKFKKECMEDLINGEYIQKLYN